MKRAGRKRTTKRPSLKTRAAAIHEAAHVISAFHWNVSIGTAGVSVTPESDRDGDDATGLSFTRWVSPAQLKHMRYASWVIALIAPFAEYRYRERNAEAYLDFADLLGAWRADFGIMVRANASDDAAISCGRDCFLLWLFAPRTKRVPVSETEAIIRDLVRDADAMLQAYWDQIVAFANVLLGTDELHLSPTDVHKWCDADFHRYDVALSARAPRSKVRSKARS